MAVGRMISRRWQHAKNARRRSAHPPPPTHAGQQPERLQGGSLAARNMGAAAAALLRMMLLATLHRSMASPTPAPEPLPPARHDEIAAVDDEVLGRIGLLLQGDGAYIEHEEQGLRHARAMAKMSPEERRKRELALVREAAHGTISRDHGGDTHSFFSSLDSSKDEHLSDAELLALMGADPVSNA